jgi:hypothetical protein
MSGENYLGSSENCLKNLYSTDFGIGTKEYIYICGTWTSFDKQIYIYGLKPFQSQSMDKIFRK